MVLDKIPNTKIFTQRDVRETPAGSSSATALSVTDATYLTLSLHADLTAERVLTAGGGIDFNDSGANGTLTISGEDSTAGNKGIVIVAGGEGMDVSYASGTATVSGENASTVNKGIASFNAGDFDTAAGVVTIDDSGVDHNATGNYTVTQHRVWENSIAQNIHADNYTNTGDTTAHASFSQLDFASAGHTGFAAALGADDNYVTDAEKTVIGNTSGTNTGDQDTTYTANETNITLVGTEFRLKNKTSYWSCSGINFKDATNSDTFYTGGRYDIVGAAVGLAHVSLPNGAVVTGCVVYGNDATETWTLYRALISAGETTGTLATENFNTEDTTISNATIDNTTYSYFIKTSALNSTDEIDGARIKYTTDYD